jgi:hypothetical protein
MQQGFAVEHIFINFNFAKYFYIAAQLIPFVLQKVNTQNNPWFLPK